MNRNRSIDTIKGFACIAVVLIHYNWSNDFGVLIKTISRFAVPFFFFVSGYYLLDRNMNINRENIRRKIKHIFNLILQGALIYLVFCIVWNILMYDHWSIIQFIKEKIYLERIIKLIVTNDPFEYAHFWYLLALVYNYIIVYLFGEKISDKCYFPIAILLMTGFSLLAEFNEFSNFKNYYQIFDSEANLVLSNMFIFRALPFFLLGISVRKNQIILTRKISLTVLTAVCGIGSLFAVVENYFFGIVQFYVGSYIVVFALILISVWYPASRIKVMEYVGNKLSMYIYIYHILVGKVFDLFANKLNLWGVGLFKYFRPIIVICASIALSWLIVRFTERKTIKISEK